MSGSCSKPFPAPNIRSSTPTGSSPRAYVARALVPEGGPEIPVAGPIGSTAPVVTPPIQAGRNRTKLARRTMRPVLQGFAHWHEPATRAKLAARRRCVTYDAWQVLHTSDTPAAIARALLVSVD